MRELVEIGVREVQQRVLVVLGGRALCLLVVARGAVEGRVHNRVETSGVVENLLCVGELLLRFGVLAGAQLRFDELCQREDVRLAPNLVLTRGGLGGNFCKKFNTGIVYNESELDTYTHGKKKVLR